MAKKPATGKSTKKTVTKKAARRKTTAKKTPSKAAARKKKATARSGSYGARVDYGAPVEQYFAGIDDADVRASSEALRKLVRQAIPKARESIKWGVPVYEQDGCICAVVAKKGYSTLQFFDAGTSLADPAGLLEGTGKGCRHVKIRDGKRIPTAELKRMVKEAAAFMAGR